MKSKFAQAILLISAICIAAGASPIMEYKTGLLRLGTGYSAALTCGCIFISKHDEDFCRAQTRISPNVFSAQVDIQKRQVTSSVFWFFSSTADYLGEKKGCTLR